MTGKTFVIACATVIEEMLPCIPEGIGTRTLEFGLHTNPKALNVALQEAIDEAGKTADTVLLGYGLCSQAIIGLVSTDCRLVIPRVDDCISIFLGSREAYTTQAKLVPGTYYLTKGWLEVGDTPFGEYDYMLEKMGRERADRMIQLVLKNYSRLAFINTGLKGLESYRRQSQELATRFNLRFEEIEGSDALVKKLIQGPWDDEFIVLEPGQKLSYEHYFIPVSQIKAGAC
ncbi:MAG: DUF1638 domain-containing protein [Anaerolineales bacterium]|nr:DUF1638 domain-containing protein [Anaerolineales bacterium]